MTEHKTDMNITKIDKYKKTEQQLYDGPRDRYDHYWNWQIHFFKWFFLLEK